jgi:ParB family chromosome partitioning protein
MANTKKIRTGLGKGLGALIPNNNQESPRSENTNTAINNMFDLVHIKDVIKNPYQPRIVFEPEALEELKDSISQHGVIQPITVRKTFNGYELISGERRLRASKELGLETIPAYIREGLTNKDMLEIALIENLQREDLNPIEIALGYKRLIDECDLTQENAAIRLGKKRSTISNYIRLLKLPKEVQNGLSENIISMGHARSLITLPSEQLIIQAYNKIVDKGLSVRDTEKLVKDLTVLKEPKKELFHKSPEINELEDRLRANFATEIKIKTKNNKSGSIELQFYSEDDLERIMELLLEEKS